MSYANHNHLMQSFEGMDGIKTGFINASGFNLAASAVRDNHRLIGVVLGGESARSRDLKMAQLLNASFARLADSEAASRRPRTTPPAGSPNSLAHRAAQRHRQALSPVGRAEAAIAAPRAARHAKANSPDWSIQVGAFAQHAAAERAGALSPRAAARGLKSHSVLVLGPIRGDKDRLYRTRVGNFTEHDAEMACRALHRQHRACAVIAPDATQRGDRRRPRPGPALKARRRHRRWRAAARRAAP